jgi:hypothetical protein
MMVFGPHGQARTLVLGLQAIAAPAVLRRGYCGVERLNIRGNVCSCSLIDFDFSYEFSYIAFVILRNFLSVPYLERTQSWRHG